MSAAGGQKGTVCSSLPAASLLTGDGDGFACNSPAALVSPDRDARMSVMSSIRSAMLGRLRSRDGDNLRQLAT